MVSYLLTLIQTVVLAGTMLLLLETGRRIGLRMKQLDPVGSHLGLGAVESAVFGLMGLIIALTFAGAALRFDQRRSLIIDEANAIGTAYLRVDLLPDNAQTEVRNLFREYLDTRIEIYRSIDDKDKIASLEIKLASLQAEIWKRSVTVCRSPENLNTALLLLPALNSMFDICSTRTAIRQIHQPNIIFIVMVLQALICAMIAGYGLALRPRRSWVHLIGFSIVLVVTLLVIIDLEYPRAGIIRIDVMDYLLMDLRKLMR